ncbi:hypothetical protein DRJ22_02620 [Candidatus Woesearchaeota archaeon]|nr:MAG: hypothetical protein B6U93_02755 [Candidatus Woesearchaeota archaeon ex4484_78]RLE46167.1 MAG: hypothetical protein DRJ22_02620 [Candidatus Woesearchaeota archaeon]
MAQPVKEVAILLDKIGFIDVVLPFMLVFTITYAVLEKTKVLGKEEDKRKLNIITSLAISLMTVFAINVLGVMNVIIRYFVILLIVGFLTMLVLGMVGAKFNSKNKILMSIIGLIMLFTIFYGLMQSGTIAKKKMQMLLLPFIALTALVATIIAVFSKTKTQETGENKRRPERVITPHELEQKGNLWKEE